MVLSESLGYRDEMGSKLPKQREQSQIESFFRLLLGEIRREIIVVVQFKTKRCITAENMRPFCKRNRILVQLKL